ncbi:DNA cytosine methyltransferase, partial [Francisella tularensis subsp. holarctica]|uniref:DNA cytosine methyltransferase n=1 Tax=Francisella tularensis TaxID=263 RepID=UPI002381AB49
MISLEYEKLNILSFLAENVSGMLSTRHTEALTNNKKMFEDAGYNISFKLLYSSDFKVTQNR